MKNLLSLLTFVVAFLAFAALLTGCAPDNKGPVTTTANMATPEATPDTAAIEKELLRIENDWPRIMKERDGQAVRRVDADDAHLLSWDGTVATKEVDAQFIESGSLTFESMEMSDLKVKALSSDAAVVTGMITITGGKIKGSTKDISGQYRFVDTFARRNSEWRLMASSSVKLSAEAAAAAMATPTPKATPSPIASPAAKASPATAPATLAKPSPIVKPKPKPPALPVNSGTP